MDYSDALRGQSLRLESKIKTLLNSDLKGICKSEGLPISGVKAALQQRILQRIQDAVTSGDSTRLNDLAAKITNAGSQSPSQYPPAPSYQSSTNYPSRNTTSMTAYGQAAGFGQNGHNSRIIFKYSPFYDILEPLTPVSDLPVMHANRSTVPTNLTLSSRYIQRLNSDKSLRVMVYCATELPVTNTPVDIAFPNQVEIKVNSESFQGNLRGVKKKPGTTRPADITNLLRKTENYRNLIQITYAGTDKKFHYLVNLVKKHSVDDLVARIKKGNRIAKQTVINEMRNKANDPDIIATSTTLSLKCPVSYTRMNLPCRSTVCNHNQCFDAASFLQLQEQGPQWTCPTCNTVIKFDTLAIDDYVSDILNKVSKSTEQVTVNPDGTWVEGATNDSFKTANGSSRKRPLETVDFDDFIEVKSRNTSAPISTSSFRSPAASSPTTTNSANKKAAPVVIDLTLSDDEDAEVPRRPVKRQSTGSFMGSMSQTQTPAQSSSQSQHTFPRGLSFQLPSHNSNQTGSNYSLPHSYSSNYGSWSFGLGS